MRLIPLLGCLVAGYLGASQAAEFSVQTLDIPGKNNRGEAYSKGQMTLPLIKVAPSGSSLPTHQADGAASAKIAQKINARLALIDTLGNERQQFTVSRQDARLLTLAFDSEGCGAYCESYNTWYSFDLQDGSLLTTANLFTPQGMRALAARLRQTQITRYRQQLKTLSKQLAIASARGKTPAARAGQGAPSDTSDLEDRIALNQSCLDNQFEKLAQLQKAQKTATGQALTQLEYSGFVPFEITDKAFKLSAGRCSNHAMRALDDVGDVILSLDFPELAPWLTAYGQAVLLNQGTAPPAERLFEQVLLGTLGSNTAISMLLEKGQGNDINSISGSYFYDRIRSPIALGGTQTGQTLQLKETIEGRSGQPAQTASFTLSRTGNQLRGQWTHQATSKTLEVRLAP